MIKKVMLLLVTMCLMLAALAIPTMAGTIEDDHSALYEEIYPQTHAVCMNERYLFRFCKICSVFVDVNTYAPEGHLWVQYRSIQPTCTDKGRDFYKCKKCGVTEDRESTLATNALNHKFPDNNWMSFEMWEKVDSKHVDGPHSSVTLIDAHTGSGCKYKWYPVICYANERYVIYCANGCGTTKTLFKNNESYPPNGSPGHKYYINSVEYQPTKTVVNYRCANPDCPFDYTVTYPGKLNSIPITSYDCEDIPIPHE